MPPGWQSCSSTAIDAYRFLPGRGVLQIVFEDGRLVYDYPCDDALFAEFEAAPSKGRFVNRVLKPQAEQRGWSPRPHAW